MNVLPRMRAVKGNAEARARSLMLHLMLLAGLGVPHAATALRPFDSTDADTAKLHEVEIEFGPVGYLKDGDGRFLTAPALVLNYGVAPGTELVAEGTLLHKLGRGDNDARIGETGLFVKHLWRAGSLQDATGPSVATELGVLLPELRGDSGVGASLAGIVSQQWDFGSVHVNAMVESTRSHHLDLFGGVILEGPARWLVRPVAEVYVEREYSVSRTRSVLVGAIWQAGENLAFDLGLRRAHDAGQDVSELRLGLTWSFEP